jgi:hypothetical protein
MISRASETRSSASRPALCREEGFPKTSKPFITAALASSQGFVVAALSRYINYHKSFHVLSQLFLL